MINLKVKFSLLNLISVIFVTLLIFVQIAAILYFNNGHFIYSLDDPYIHLAVAEMILKGHYGVNLSEITAPSSSIIWPFILAPISMFELSPLVLNIIAALATAYLVSKIIEESFSFDQSRPALIVQFFLVATVIVISNILGLVLTGMEHVYQVLIVVIILYGLIRFSKDNNVPSWLIIAIVVGPLFRYENLAVSIPAIIFLAVNKKYLHSIIILLVTSALLILFSLFLTSIGLDPIPASISVKSRVVVEGGGKLQSMFNNFYVNMMTVRAAHWLMTLFLMILAYLIFGSDNSKRQIACVGLLAIGMHMAVGRFGWFNRYEIYIWMFALMLVIYLYANILQDRLASYKNSTLQVVSIIMMLTVFSLFSSISYMSTSLFRSVVSSRAVYLQQYQMHRFVTEYYKKPVAVNDLGWVAYKNDIYVLDLWGLANREAAKLRKQNDNTQWAESLVEKNNVELIMIYDYWFDGLPENWVKLGELSLGVPIGAVADNVVAFYTVEMADNKKIKQVISDFASTLPAKASFNFDSSTWKY